MLLSPSLWATEGPALCPWLTLCRLPCIHSPWLSLPWGLQPDARHPRTQVCSPYLHRRSWWGLGACGALLGLLQVFPYPLWVGGLPRIHSPPSCGLYCLTLSTIRKGKLFLCALICSKMCVCVLVTQLCPILWDPMDWSPPGSSVHGILQAIILESVAISLSRAFSRPRDRTWVSCIAGRFFTIWATREALSNWRPANLKRQINRRKGTQFSLIFTCRWVRRKEVKLKVVVRFRGKEWFKLQKVINWDFPGGSVVKNLPYNAGDAGSTTGQGIKISYATEQRSSCNRSTESEHSGALSSGAWSHNKRVHVLQGKITQDATKIPCARLDTANMPFLFSQRINYEQETGKMLTSSALSPLTSRGQQRQEDHSLRPAERHPLSNCTDWFTDRKRRTGRFLLAWVPRILQPWLHFPLLVEASLDLRENQGSGQRKTQSL